MGGFDSIGALVRAGVVEADQFKPESDDPRSSLSYKLRRLLVWAGANVRATDPYVKDDRLVSLREALDSDIVVTATSHSEYL